MLGNTLGHYRIIEHIGSGGMGVVYRAHDEKLDRDVALKVLPPGTLADESVRKKFRKEALALAQLNHPNIETIFESADQDGVDFLVMELIPGRALNYKLKEGPLPLPEVARLGIQLADGLAAAHDRGIIHCDLKPHNLILTPDGRLKILDFGLARRIHPIVTGDIAGDVTRSITVETGPISGTVPYMSPEQLTGQATDARSDIFSAGAVLYEMATGQRAFPQTQVAQIMGAILHQEPEPAVSLNPRISPGLDALLRKALDKTASQRYQTAGELRVALESLIAGSGSGATAAVGSSVTTPGPHTTRLSPAAKWAIALGLVVLLAIGAMIGLNVGGVGGGLRGGLRSRLERAGAGSAPANAAATGIPVRPAQIRPAVAVLGFKNLSGRPDEAWLSTALAEMLTTEVGAGEKLRTIPGENIARMKMNLSLTDTESYGADTLRKIRASIGSDYVLLGSYLALGNGQVRLDLRLENTSTGELLSTMSAQGTEMQIANLVARVGVEIRKKLGAGQITPEDSEIVQVSIPSDPEAARAYVDALTRMRNFDTKGAQPLLAQVIKLQPHFALAHLVMARAWKNLGYLEKSKAETKLAFDDSSTLPRAERLSVEGAYDESIGQRAKAIEIYKSIWNFYPDEIGPGIALVDAQIADSQFKNAEAGIDALRKLPASGMENIQIDIDEARVAQGEGDFKREIDITHRNLDRARALDARSLEADMLFMESRPLEMLGDLKGGQKSCEQARDVYAALGDQAGVSRAITCAANMLADQGDNASARRMYDQAEVIAEKIGNKNAQEVNLHDIGIIVHDQGEYLAAKKFIEASLAIDRDTGYKVGIAQNLTSLGNIASDLGDMSGSEKLFRDALAISQEIGDRAAEALISNNLAAILYGYGNDTGAQAMFESAQAIYQQTGQKDGIALTDSNLGEIRAELGDLEGGKARVQEAITLSAETGDKQSSGIATLGMGQILREQGDLAGAHKFYDESLAIRTALGDKGAVAETNAFIADLDNAEGNYAGAYALATKSAAEAHREKAADLEAEVLAILARAAVGLNKIPDAQTAVARAAALAKKSQERHSIAGVQIAQAEVNAATGKSEDAVKSLEALVADMNHLGLVSVQFEARLELGEVQIKSPKTAAAGRKTLSTLEKDATAKSFLFIAHRAHAATTSESA
jgi:tetratricopeptide (TPR) repeat protein/TolB-like protein